MSDTITLTVPALEGKRPARTYTFAQLQDLQSRLMLVAGKAQEGRESIDRFTMVMQFGSVFMNYVRTFAPNRHHAYIHFKFLLGHDDGQ